MCALDHSNIIFLLEYSECFITDARVLEKFVRISGVYVHTGTRRSKQLVLTEELFTDGIVVKRCQML